MARYGSYFRREEILTEHPEIIPEWDAWLEANPDPGYYESYKVKDQSVLPYIDGHPQWVCDVYMPPELMDKIGMAGSVLEYDL